MSAELDYTLAARYFAGLCPAEEVREVETWAAESPHHRHEIERLREVWTRAGRASPARRGDVGLRRVAERLGLATVAPSARSSVRLVTALEARRRSRILAPVSVAAAVLFLIAISWLAQRQQSHVAERPTESVIATALGQRLGLKLPDGTLVTLAPGSTLRTPGGFGLRSRALELEGEAVFTVAHDSTLPFAVRTSRAVATDLGTRFVVRAYRDDPITEVVVAEGQVAVRETAPGTAAARDSVIAGRGERVQVRDGGRVELARGVPLGDYLGWTEGRLVFRSLPLREAAKRLGRWYDIEVRLEPDAIGDRRIEAVAENEPATDVLRSIAASLDLRLSRAGRVYTLSAH